MNAARQITRMMIVEAISEESAREIQNLMDAHVSIYMVGDDGFVTSSRLKETGGNMVVLEMTFSSLDAALRYNSGRQYRCLVSSIDKFLIGNPVIKIFERYSYTEAIRDPNPCDHKGLCLCLHG